MTDIPRLNKAQRAAKRRLSNEAQSFLNEFFSTYGGDFNTYNKLAAKYPTLVSSEVLKYLKNIPGYAEQYPEVFGEVPSLESRYATQAVSPSTEEKDTENPVKQNVLNTSSEATEDTYPEKSLQEANLKESNFVFPQEPPKEGSNIKTANLRFPDGEKVPQELNKVSRIKPRVIKDTSNGPIVLNDPNHRTTKNVQVNSITPERAAANQMVNQFAGIPVEVTRAKNSGYAQPPLNHATDAIWDRVRKAGLSSPEQAIRSGLFSPDEVRYITENDLWRYRQ